MPDYQKGKIYCLRSYQTDLVYIGSTLNPLYKRKGQHKNVYNLWLKNNNNYVSSFEIIKYDDAYIELVENYPCNSREELLRREGQIIRETKNCCNKRVAGRTKNECDKDNIQQRNVQKSEWVKKNKEHVKDYKDNWYQENKERILIERINRYQKNRDKIRTRMSEKVHCECGSIVCKGALSQHRKTKKHQLWVEQNSES